MKEKTKLFIGAKVYRSSYNAVTHVIVIGRVTATQAISENGLYKFDINVSENGYVKKKGDSPRWENDSYSLETPELQQKLWNQKAVNKLRTTDFSKLKAETVKKLIDVLNESEISN